MIVVLVLSAALAVPPDYQVTKEDVEGCTLMLGPREADGVVPMRAECHWPDITLEKFDGFFKEWGDHDLSFSTVEASDVIGSEGGKLQVRQVHVTKGISDRFIILDGERVEVEGGYRYQWTRSSHTETAPDGMVEAIRSDGYWEATAAEAGGVNVVHQLSYDPGGRVPGFLVRWFQTGGLAGIVTDLHAYLTTH